MTRAAALLGLLLVVGCDEAAPERRAQGISPVEARSRSAQAPAPPPPATAPRSQLPSPFRAPELAGASTQTPGGSWPGSLAGPGSGADASALGTASVASAEGAGAQDAGRPRDLAGELRALLEPVPSCLDAAAVAAAGGRVTVTVVVHLVSSGRVSRATATAPGQPSSALHCLEQRVARSALRGPIPEAPREVSVTIPIEGVTQPASH